MAAEGQNTLPLLFDVRGIQLLNDLFERHRVVIQLLSRKTADPLTRNTMSIGLAD